MSRGDEPDDQQQAGMPDKRVAVCLQCLIDICNPSFSWSPSRFEACRPGAVYLDGQLVGGHACRMSKPLYILCCCSGGLVLL